MCGPIVLAMMFLEIYKAAWNHAKKMGRRNERHHYWIENFSNLLSGKALQRTVYEFSTIQIKLF